MLTQVATSTENKQAPTSGTPAPQAPEATEAQKQELLSPKFAALARKEKQLLAEKMKWQTERTQYEQERKELEELRNFKKKFESNPLDVVDYDKITEAYLAQPNPELRPLLAKIQQLEEGQKTFLTQAEQQQKQQYDAAVKQIHSDATRLVSADPAYEVLKELGTVDKVVEKITDHYKETGELKEIEEAAKEVQEEFVKELSTLFKLPAIQKLFTTQTPATEEPQNTAETQAQAQQQPDTTKQPQPTLSTRMVQSSAAKPQSAKERRDRAIKAFLGQLNT